ncbi:MULTISPECIES: phosphatase PAP2 family protein [Arthrobacter]|uniref:phosphatase PAP2 family protein n=1 Tax=Arthrobacter TaxID=1663 RepID=UPI00209B6DFB|nr:MULTISPECIES: phosphatase PAP2 family protein [Arthrobacter]MDQ0212244.1 membrane-associated phospholipid phosphatase [Arthrobacter bambusae]MDQ0234580.1 membrane-associated phospholipid phosphatase [Arthrobacter bambusae]
MTEQIAIKDGRIGVRGERRRVARTLTEVFQPPAVVSVLLLISPAVQPGFPGTIWFGVLGAFFVCVLPFAYVLIMVRLGKLSDHHVSDRKERAPLLMLALVSVVVGLLVLNLINAPTSVSEMILALIGGIAVLAAVSLVWKISGHASAISAAAVIAALMFGPAWLPLLLLVPAVGWSRVVLRAHTPAQVIAGSLFGGVVIAGLWWALRGWLG